MNRKVKVKPGQRRGSTAVLTSLDLIPRAIMEADLGAQGKNTYPKINELKYKYFHLQTRDLEGALLEELEEIPISTRTTGKEIDLVPQQEHSGVLTVIGRATGMTITVEGADVNRSKHYMIWVFIPLPSNSL